MFDKIRIKDAERNVASYLSDNLLRKQTNETAKAMYVQNCDLSLRTAVKLSEMENETYKPYLWIIVTSYYAMFYISNAILLELGYKVGDKVSHKVTEDALIVYVRNNLKRELLEAYEETKEEALEIISSKVDSILKSYEYERSKRSRFQYEMSEDIKKSKSITSLERAKLFVFEMKKMIKQ
jgi:uncharacterized protein (UPF0332 family)